MKKDKIGFGKLIIAIVIFVITVLLLVAITTNLRAVFEDYGKLLQSDIGFLKVLKLDFPPMQNPIGPFGAFFGYWIVYLFGKFFGISLLMSAAILSVFAIFFRDEKHLIQKIVSFIIFALFVQILIFLIEQKTLNFAGIIPWQIYLFLTKIFSHTGTYIISVAAIIVTILIIFEFDNIQSLCKLIWTYIVKLIKQIIAKIKAKPAKKKKKSKKKKQRKKNKEPTITNHVTEDETEVIIDKEQLNKQRRLSQDKAEMPSDDEKKEYEKPDVNTFLKSHKQSRSDKEKTEKNIKRISRILEDKLAEFGVEADVQNVNIGPVITQYELKPAPGVKVSKFERLADDLALAIKATSIRVQAPIPGRGLVGIEIPNIEMDVIYLKDILLSEEMELAESKLAIALGKDISGNSMVADLAKMPHLLIAGATGSGKSVCVNTIINSLLFRTKPEEVRLILIDPKRIELAGYKEIPHLIQKVVTDNEDALTVLNWGVEEMERRYKLLPKYKVRNIDSYNKKLQALKNKGEEIEDEILPKIVIVVDEFSDLIITVGKDIEKPITRLAQMARAIGIHIILATQRPSAKVITGMIKANFPSRIAFKVASRVDSRVIIDGNGAERLLGRGDSLFLPPGKSKPIRIHGAFISDDEIQDIVEYLKTQPKPDKEIEIIKDEDSQFQELEFDDELLPKAAVAVVKAETASVSMLQRHFKIGYARAGRLIDMLEQAGIVGPHVGSKPRDVLATEEDLKIYGFMED